MIYFLLLVKSILLFAHQNSLNSSGHELKWVQTEIPLQFNSNTTDLMNSDAQLIFDKSINEWNQLSPKKFIKSQSSNHQILFEKNFRYGSGVLGVTELNFSTNGTIQRAIIRLNDDYTFKSNPGKYGFGQFYLGDVLTHELGHSLGLSHSEVINSTMFYSAFSGQHSIALDDKSGIRQKYSSSYGEIRGVVMGGNSVAVLGAHVQAISLKTGDSSGAITNDQGVFRLGGLDLDDSYYLYISPVKRVESLPGYFSNLQTNFCPGKYVGSFFSGCGLDQYGHPQAITLNQQRKVVDVGSVSIHCSLKTQPAYQREKLKNDFAPFLIVDHTDLTQTKKSFVGYFRQLTDSVWSKEDQLKLDFSALDIQNQSFKKLKIKVLGQAFGSRMEFMGKIYNDEGQLIAQSGINLDPLNGIYKTDLSFDLNFSDDPLRNIYLLKLQARKLSPFLASQTFPSYEEFSSDIELPYLLMTQVTNSQGDVILDQNEQLIEDNKSCLDAPLTYKVSQSASVNDDNSQSDNQDQGTPLSCGTTAEPPSSSGGMSVIVGFMLITFLFTSIRKTKNFLS